MTGGAGRDHCAFRACSELRGVSLRTREGAEAKLGVQGSAISVLLAVRLREHGPFMGAILGFTNQWAGPSGKSLLERSKGVCSVQECRTKCPSGCRGD